MDAPNPFLCSYCNSYNSSTNIKRKRARQQPCLVPLLGLNHIEVKPLLLTHVSESWYTVCTHLIYISPNPYSFCASAMKDQLTESKAFWKSSASRRPGSPVVSV